MSAAEGIHNGEQDEDQSEGERLGAELGPQHRAQAGLASWLFGSGDDEGEEPQPVDVTTQVRGCEIRGNFYERGALVEESSGPCLECR